MLSPCLFTQDAAEGQTTIRGFVVPKYDADMQLVHKLEGDEAEMKANGDAVIRNLRLNFYRNGEIETRVSSPVCTYNRKTNQGSADQTIRIAREDLVVTGEDYTIDGEKERVVIKKNAKVVIRQTDVRLWGEEE